MNNITPVDQYLKSTNKSTHLAPNLHRIDLLLNEPINAYACKPTEESSKPTTSILTRIQAKS